jgi:hypothetical protein
LRRTIQEREKQRNALHRECEAIARKINAPIIDLLKSDPRSAEGLKELDKLRRRTKRPLPPLPKAPKVHANLGVGSVDTIIGAPYPNHHVVQNRAVGQADDSGNLRGVVHPKGGGAWIWCGVGIPFQPLWSKTQVSITPSMTYNFRWWGIGSWGFSAHTEGFLGLTVDRYDNQFRQLDHKSFRKNIWNHTTSTNASDHGSNSLSDTVPIIMDVYSQFLIWVTLEIYCNNTSGWSEAYGQLQAQCLSIAIQQEDIGPVTDPIGSVDPRLWRLLWTEARSRALLVQRS